MRRSRPGLALALVLCCAAAAPPPATEVRAGIQYGPLPAEQGDLYLPPAGSRQRRAALLVIHGGGWIGGSRMADAEFSRFLAENGFVVFNIDYTLGVASVPETRWPAQLADCQRAVRWLKQHAAELRLDPARIGAVGDSAGGTLAVLLGVLGENSGSAGGHPAVAAVVDQFGVMDLAALGSLAGDMNKGLFGTATPTREQMQAVSPLPSVTGTTAPMLVVHGDRDEFVPPSQSRDLAAALAAHGVSAQLMVFAGGHAFAGTGGDAIATLFGQEAAWLKRQLSP